MSPHNWPSNWPALEDLITVLREHPGGCRRGDFVSLDANRRKGVISVAGIGWINIRRRLLSDGIAELNDDGALVLTPEPQSEPTDSLTPSGIPPERVITLFGLILHRIGATPEQVAQGEHIARQMLGLVPEPAEVAAEAPPAAPNEAASIATSADSDDDFSGIQ